MDLKDLILWKMKSQQKRINDSFMITLPIIIKKISLFFVLISILTTCSNSPKMKKMPYVTGIITAIELVEIPNKVINKSSRFETRISLNILSAFDYKGNPVPIESYEYPYFAGDSILINKFKIKQKVRIVCSSKTGRHIKMIEVIE